ncbi:MAG: putative toxin-antitoxin system toxin component, PIN family [Armatimonadota bacterium]
MRVLLDTNVVVSALLFGGPPRALLRALCQSPFELWTTRPLLRELARTLKHNKLRRAVARTGLSVDGLMQAYAGQVLVVPDAALPTVNFTPDPRDAPVVAGALAAEVDWVISGDRHLLEAHDAIGADVLTVREALHRAAALVGQQRGDT